VTVGVTVEPATVTPEAVKTRQKPTVVTVVTVVMVETTPTLAGEAGSDGRGQNRILRGR
jgi:hypothetical protein